MGADRLSADPDQNSKRTRILTTNILTQSINGLTVGMRSTDGYVNATALTAAHKAKSGQNKYVADWLRLKRTVETLEHLSSNMGIPVIELYQVFQGSPESGGGTWIHPKLATRFAIWLSDEFGYAVECWVEEWMTKAIAPAVMSMAELAVYSAQKLLEHESRLTLIEQQNLLLHEANQHLKGQVALLESSQEALELETDANAAELDRYKNGHGRYYTVAAWCNLHGHSMSLQELGNQGRKASAMCRIQNITPQPVSDPRWGIVQSYPDTILMEMNWD